MEIYSGAQSRYQIGYHMVWGVKYHKHLLNNEMKKTMNAIIKEICEKYEYHYQCVGIGTNHVHLFAGAPPKVAPAKMVQVVKSISGREMFKKYPRLKKVLWGGELWKNGYYVGTIGEGQTEKIIINYLAKQDEPEDLKQLKLFY